MPLAVMKTQMVMAGRAVARPIMEDLSGMERLVEQILDRARLGGLHVRTAHGGRLELRNAPDGGAVATMRFSQERMTEPPLLLARNLAFK